MVKNHLSTRELLWFTVIFWAACFTAMESPFSLVFNAKIEPWQLVVDPIISLIFIFDLYMHLKEKHELEKSEEHSHLQKKPFPWMILVDAFACIPFDLLGFYLGHEILFMVFRLLRMIRIVKIYYLVENIAIVPGFFKVQTILMGFLLVVHWIACGWIYIYPLPDGMTITSYYIQAVYWAVTTLTTVGYGDVTPHTDVGKIYTCFMMVTGVGMYGIVIGNITRMIASADRHKEQSREKIVDLLLFMKHYKIPDKLQTVAINHYTHLRSKRLSDNDEKIIAELPHALQNEMQIFMKIHLISAIHIFANCSQECLKDVAIHLEQINTSPGDKVLKIGDIGEEMYILAHGQMEVFLEDGTLVATLVEGQIFGESALLKKSTRNANVVSRSYCDLYKLSAQHFHAIIEKHPVLLSNIQRITEKRGQA